MDLFFPRNRTWTEDEDSQLRTFWERGATAAQIAAQLGRTRNMVIGRVNRMGLSQPKPANPDRIHLVQSVKDMSEAGRSERDIARTLGVTKGVVNSVRNGHGIAAALRQKTLRAERKVADGTTNQALRSVMVARARARGRLPSRKFQEEPMIGHPTPFDQLTYDQCRYPYGHVGEAVFGFCNFKRMHPLTSYCEFHHAKTHRSNNVD